MCIVSYRWLDNSIMSLTGQAFVMQTDWLTGFENNEAPLRSMAANSFVGRIMGLVTCPTAFYRLVLLLYGRDGQKWFATHYVVHGRARVAHCVTGRWRNVSHYCRPLRLIYVFWAQRRTARCAYSTRLYANSARGKHIVRHWSSREASLRHSSGWGNLKRFPSVSWFAHPWCSHYATRNVTPQFPLTLRKVPWLPQSWSITEGERSWGVT